MVQLFKRQLLLLLGEAQEFNSSGLQFAAKVNVNDIVERVYPQQNVHFQSVDELFYRYHKSKAPKRP